MGDPYYKLKFLEIACGGVLRPENPFKSSHFAASYLRNCRYFRMPVLYSKESGHLHLASCSMLCPIRALSRTYLSPFTFTSRLTPCHSVRCYTVVQPALPLPTRALHILPPRPSNHPFPNLPLETRLTPHFDDNHRTSIPRLRPVLKHGITYHQNLRPTSI